MRLLPETATREARLILIARAMRATADGCISIVLPAYLLALGFDALTVGVLTTATLLGSAFLTIAVGLFAARRDPRALLLFGCTLMTATGIGFATFDGFWPLLAVALVGTLNPSSGDVSVFLPLEQSVLARAVADRERTALFARYTLAGALFGALGTLAAGAPELMAGVLGVDPIQAFQAMFAGYGAVGVLAALAYRRMPPQAAAAGAGAPAPLDRSRAIVLRLAALFCLDSFAGGMVVQSLLALWLLEAFGLSLAATATVFFWANMLTALSQLAAAPLAARIGLINTMVFTHLPANVCLAAVPFCDSLPVVVGLLMARSLLSQMDVPARTSYVMAVVTPEERAAAASLTAVPRSLAAALGPALAGHLFAVSTFAWPLLLGGVLKICYDMALLFMFRRLQPPEERDRR